MSYTAKVNRIGREGFCESGSATMHALGSG